MTTIRSCIDQAVACALTLLLAAPALARADESLKFDIATQPLVSALKAFAEQANMQLLYKHEAVESATGNAVIGSFDKHDALTKLLRGTGLEVVFIADDAATIRPKTDASAVNADAAIRLAQSENNSSAAKSAESADSADSNQGMNLEEIVVTAQKREERLQDVPIAITAISGERLAVLQVTSLADLVGFVPGLNVSSWGAPGARQVIIRGLNASNDLAGPLVGTYIDDVPLGSSTARGRGTLFGLDMMPYDVEAIEVLKGPQGTLYGANAMAGLLKYTLKKPSLTESEVRIGSDLQQADGSGGADWTVRAALSMPIVQDQLAVRVSAFHQSLAGYIDNIGLGTEDSNESTQSGGRAVLRWQPNDVFWAQATVLAQNIDLDDLSVVTIDSATLQPLYGRQITSSRFPQRMQQRIRNYALNAGVDLGFATLSGTSSWSEVHSRLDEDFSVPFGSFTGIADALALLQLRPEVSKFVQEVRLTSPQNQRVEWMLGGYYTDEEAGDDSSWPTFTAAGEPLPESLNLIITDGTTSTYKEKAAFGNLTYKFSERFDVGGGVRYSSYGQDNVDRSTGLFGSGEISTHLPSQGVTTWMLNSRFHLNEGAMVYARIATGYRPGLRVQQCPNPAIPEAPCIIDSDETVNYELGYKAELLDHRLQLQLAAFHIDWKDIQATQLSSLGFPYTANTGTARSRGLEGSMAYRLFDGLTVNTALSYTDAELIEALPASGGQKGDVLPLSARWIGTVGADYTRALSERMSLLLGSTYRHKSKVYNALGNISPVGPQNIVDLYAAIQMQSASVRLYGRNIFDDHSYAGQMFSGDPTIYKYVPVQPRTVGLSIDFQF